MASFKDQILDAFRPVSRWPIVTQEDMAILRQAQDLQQRKAVSIHLLLQRKRIPEHVLTSHEKSALLCLCGFPGVAKRSEGDMPYYHLYNGLMARMEAIEIGAEIPQTGLGLTNKVLRPIGFLFR